MVDVKISALPAAAAATDAMEFPINDAGTTEKVTRAQILTNPTTTGNTTALLSPGNLFRVKVVSGDLFTVDESGIVGTAGAVNALIPFNIIAGGDWWFGYHLGNNGSGYNGLWAGLGAPTFSTFGRYGGIYENGSAPGIPYYNNSASTTWDRLVGETADQPVTNKRQLHLTPQTAPASPASGWVLYVDSADGTLKAKNSAGTVRSLAAP